MDQIKIGKFISAMRKEKGLTQVQLAEKLGVTQKSVSRWETGKNMPDLSLLQPLSTELNVSVSELLDGEKTSVKKKDVDEAINQIIDYSVKSRRYQIFSIKDINFITCVFIILIVILLVIGGFANAQTVPMISTILILMIVMLKLLFGRCPACGRPLPFTTKNLKSCPFCGIKYR